MYQLLWKQGAEKAEVEKQLKEKPTSLVLGGTLLGILY